ncbi:hypothetical protein BASA82_001238 [Batrachochytrium salamandrivorans]|uniref:AN1-type domain-containing protein n=1 Tax=Batrachochytrium salamandrivorans TaxID=1357716 RepID=A0ABQ8F4K7_9FUNG|nr:hypothetical protein BASA60_008950 [Batrachochytrium salamandrivorans]KAH6570096.1 hypothetical protein BASA62_004493 [Batrachochytrium salamandrivorans]KAH6592095.1 hypothetical protein BASA50_008241 [Batrachochytrium salamandrivorans]KAH6599892.1 hypothetical protein BASA61_002443 [Batrachochytrium salamandrivorans]KAH9259835.1 hypothetical protein BASA82_001238 [Batrachochytrium salamandrivorans]
MDIGFNCSLPSCNRLDFLPFICRACKCAFCPDHRFQYSHGCPLVDMEPTTSHIVCPECSQMIQIISESSDDTTTESKGAEILAQHRADSCPHMPSTTTTTTSSSKIQCSLPDCTTAELWGSVCRLCTQRFCLAHRHSATHNCSSIAEALENKQIQKAQISAFIAQRIPKTVDVSKSTSPAVSSPTALSTTTATTTRTRKSATPAPAVMLMKLKMNASGDPKIMTENRVYLSFYISELHTSLGLYHHKNTTIGRLVDLVASKAGIPNTNNRAGGGPMLALFHADSGEQLSNSLSLEATLASKILAQGQTLILKRTTDSRISITE